MPPTSIDGTDITGATIDGTDVQEITVDGQTVFTSGFDIPNSAIHHYPMDEGSGSNMLDNVGSVDGTINGASYITGNFFEGFALDADGIDDNVTFSQSILPADNFTILLTVGSLGSFENNRILQDGVQSHVIRTSGASTSGNPNNIVYFSFNNNSAGAFATGLTTGTHRIACGADNGSVFMFVNGSTTNVTTGTEPTGFTSDVTLFSRGAGSFMEMFADNLIITNQPLSVSEIQDDYNKQPWS